MQCASCRYLTGMDIDAAAADFQSWDIYQKVDTLSALDTYTAAALLTRTQEPQRRQLLGMLEPYLAANIVQVGCCDRDMMTPIYFCAGQPTMFMLGHGMT